MKSFVLGLALVSLFGCASATRSPSSSYLRRFRCEIPSGQAREVYLVSADKVTLDTSYGEAFYADPTDTKVKGEEARLYVEGPGRALALQRHMIDGAHGGGMIDFSGGDGTDVRGCAEED